MNLFKKHFNYSDNIKNEKEISRPLSRKNLLFFMIAEHKFDLFFFSLAFALIYLPSGLWVFLSVLLMKLSPETVGTQPWLFQFLLLLFPLFAISGPGASGLYRVARNWTRDDPHAPFHVFRSAVKDSWKGGLFFCLISGGLPLLSYFAFLYAGQYVSHIAGIAICVTFALLLLLWSMITPVLQIMTVTYNLSFPIMIWNSLFMTLRHPLRSLKTLLLANLPFLICAVFCISYPNLTFLLLSVFAVYHIIYGAALRQMILAAHGNALCEIHLNVHIPGAKVDIGLASEYTVEDS